MTLETTLPKEQPTQATTTAMKSPRLWPGLLILLFQAIEIVITYTPSINNFTRFMSMVLSVLISLVLFLLYWTIWSRTSWKEKLLIPLFLVALPFAVGTQSDHSVHVSIWSYGIPSCMLVTLLVFYFNIMKAPLPRVLLSAFLMLLSLSWYPFVRMEGVDGAFFAKFNWRNAPTTEQLLVIAKTAAKTDLTTIDNSEEAWTYTESYDWPNFRGSKQNSTTMASPSNNASNFDTLKEKWRIKIGPAWSSFIKIGKRLYTQEQRGTDELVTCYDTMSGTEIWKQSSNSRFDESVSGPGPRATPSYHEAKIYAYGAKAMLSCLEARTGKVIWQKDMVKDYEAAIPQWGVSTSPLIYNNLFIVYVDGKDPEAGWMAFDVETGKEVWKVADDGMNYSTAYYLKVEGNECILLATKEGWKFIAPLTGETLHTLMPDEWRAPPMVQPQFSLGTNPNYLLLPFGDGQGLECYVVTTKDASTWEHKKLWRSNKLRPSFNDFVVDSGNIIGFNQNMFTCITADTGEQFWKKKGRFGFGQVMLLEHLHLLFIQAETGELVVAQPLAKDLEEVARFPGLKGKTWNHPIASEGHIYLRNSEEALCYEIIGK
jgi:outer membrane protein assembly factor BamB